MHTFDSAAEITIAVTRVLVRQLYRRAFGDVESRGANSDNIVPGADGELYSTHSAISGYRWTYVVGVSLATSFELLPAHVPV